MPKIIFQPLMIANPLGRLAEDFLLKTPGGRLTHERYFFAKKVSKSHFRLK